jgi:hypothetical protein
LAGFLEEEMVEKKEKRSESVAIKESAAGYIDFRGDRAANKKIQLRNLPEKGTFILYNEILRCHDRDGNPGKMERGIGRVIEYTTTLMGVQIFVRPDYSQRIYFQIFDVSVGLIEYVELNNYLYIGGGSIGYSYADLDIRKPHPDIINLIKN